MAGDVYANNLEISGKAVQAQTIAAFPDVCFTPPQTPATPPGVPIPYPSFGMASDTENGTGTVKIGDKEVNIKNKSDESKTSGTEAGCAPKKGVVSSKNTGKKYFKMWSPDVKFEGEPVIRFSDIATHNHASEAGNAPPFPELCKANAGFAKCVTVLNELGMQVHEHGKSPCDTDTDESEHYFENQMMQTARKDGDNYKPWGDKSKGGYSTGGAPCVCMQAWHNKEHTKGPGAEDGKKRGTPHNKKTAVMRDFLKKNEGKTPQPTLGEAMDETKKAYKEHDPRISKQPEEKQKEALDCLELIYLTYLATVADKKTGDDGKPRNMTTEELRATPIRTPY